MMNNQTVVEKAAGDLATGDFVSDGGYLQEDQAKTFIRVLIKRAVLMGLVTVPTMRSHTKELNKINFASRVLRPGQSGQALNVAQRSRPDLGPPVTINSHLVKGEVRLDNETLEDSIEQGNLKNTVMQELAKAVSRDIEEVVINGDTTSSDPYLALFDGVLAQATSNVIAAGGVTLNKGVLRDMLKSLPSEFHTARERMVYLTSTNAEIDYRDSISDRQTASGDRALAAVGESAVNRVGYGGVPVIPIPLFPEDLGVGTDETNVLLLDPKNINVGFWRKVQLETDKDVSAGELVVVVTLRFDTKYEHEPAVAKATGIIAA